MNNNLKSSLLKVEKPKVIPVDSWEEAEEDKIFKSTKDFIVVPVSSFFGLEPLSPLDYFKISVKRSYNNPKTQVKEHITKYINYFIKFYDQEKELLSIYTNIKYLIDCQTDNYGIDAFVYDLKTKIYSGMILYKIKEMNRDNYNLHLNYRKCDVNLQYNDKHAYIIFEMSLLMIVSIPLLTHYIAVNKINNADGFLLYVYDYIIDMYIDSVDIYSKFYETSITSVERSKYYHSLWGKQDIRGVNETTHTLSTVKNIIVNIMPRYVYDKNIVSFNFTAIKNNIAYQVTDIGYEFDFHPLSSSKRDEENNSEFDKFESYLTKMDESLYLQNKVNCEQTMRNLELQFGPFDQQEINYYAKRLSNDNKFIINDFQKNLIFNMMYKYFGDTSSIKTINRDDYIKLIIISKKILTSSSMVILPYILSSKITRLINRKNINSKELQKLELSPFYITLKKEYKNDKIIKQIHELIATILVSDFEMIEYNDKEGIDGKKAEIIPDILIEEIIMYMYLVIN